MDQSEEYTAPSKKFGKVHNVLPLSGNEATMNLNPLILANIQGSSYFKVHLFKLKTYHEVVDEIYYQVKHLEPWERGSRKTSGQTGMCGGVRGVGAGGIVSTAYCLLYKLYTLRLTRKQVNGLMAHTDSPYIRALGFMYIRYTQPPADLYDWYEEYLQDEEEVDVKAGGGQMMTIGQMLYQWLTKLDWFSTLFPRIPVPIQKQIERKLSDYCRDYNVNLAVRYNTNNAVAAPPAAQPPAPSETVRSGGRDRDRGGNADYTADRRNDRYSADRRNDRERRIRSRSKSREREYRRPREERNSRERDYGGRSSGRNDRPKDRYSKDYSSKDYSSKDYSSKDSRSSYKDGDRDRSAYNGGSGSGSGYRSRSRERDRRYR